MATIAPPPPAPPSPARGPQSKSSGADHLINERIEDARRSLWWAELIRTGLKLAIASIAAVFVWLVIDQWVYSPNVAVRCIVFLGLLGLASWYVKRRVLPLFGSTVCPEYAARALEKNLPELRHSLTSYVTLRQEGQKSDLQTRVVRSMGSLTAGRLKNHDEIPEEAVGNFRWWIATAVAFAILLGYSVASPKNAWQSVQRLAVPVASIAPAQRVTISDILPGDIEAVAGRDVELAATVVGLRVEESVTCQWDLPSGREELELTLDTDSNRFVGKLQLPHTASGVVPYTITAGDATAGPFQLRVQDLPVIALESVKYQPPQYTGESPHTSSSGSIAGLAGTQVRILATTNRPVTKARIEFNPRLRGDRVQATAGAKELIISEDGTTLSFVFTLRTAAGRSAAVEQDSYRIVVHDATGQRNSEPIVYPIRIVSDLPPEVSITMPFQSPKEVPIDAQQVIEVHASDPDYGLKHVQLEIQTSLNLIAEPVLWSHLTGQKGNQVSEYRFRPAEHNLPIGSSVQIVAVATDNRASDETVKLDPNVTRSDPIEIKITAASRLPEPDDPNAGGLSEPDDRPASDHQDSDQQDSAQQGDEQSNGDQGEQQQGSGGSGGSEGADSQSGNQQGGDSTSKQGNSKGEQSSDQQNDQGGNGQDAADQESEPSDSDTSDNGENSSGSGKGNSSNEDQGNENSSGGSNSENQGDQTNDSKNPENGSNTSEGNQSQSDGNQGSDATDGGNPENQGGQTSDANKQQSGDPSASQQNGDSGQNSEQSPEHDGEAFERIRDFLEEKRKQQQEKNQESGNQESGNQESGNQESGNQESGNQESGNQESGNQESGNQESGNQESGNQESGNQESGNQESGNQESGNQESGNQESGNQESGNQESGNQESGNQESGNQESGNQESGNQESGNQESGNQESGNQESGNQESGNQESGNQESGNQESGNQDSGNQESGNQDSGNQESGNQESGNQESGNQESGNQESGNQESGNQESGSQESGSQESGNQDSGSQDSGSQDSGSQDSGSQDSGRPRLRQPRLSQDSGSQDSAKTQAAKTQPRLRQPRLSQDSGSQDSAKTQVAKTQAAKTQPRLRQPRLRQPRLRQPRLRQPRLRQPRLRQPRLRQPRLRQPRLRQPRLRQPRLR